MKVRLSIILKEGSRRQYFLVALSRALNAVSIREPDIMISSTAALMMEAWGYIPRKYVLHRLAWKAFWWGPDHCRQCLEDERNYIFEPREQKLKDLWKETS